MVKIPNWQLPAGLNPIDLGLDRVEEALEKLGNPHKKLQNVIHVAGTNGKGSTIAFIKAMIEADGKTVNVYTSPHLVRFNERIVLKGKEITDELLDEVLTEIKTKCDGIDLTFFEATTIAAFVAFGKTQADYNILEVGLGGRLDATNVVDKSTAVITPVSFDHMEFLGSTLTEIAYEKASIIKSNCKAFIGKQEGEALKVINIYTQAKKNKTKILERDFDFEINPDDGSFEFRNNDIDMWLPTPSLAGHHQYMNAALAIEVALDAGISEKAIVKGITSASWKARMQNLSKDIYLDGGHNEAAALIITDYIYRKNIKEKKKNTAIVGLLKTKDFKSFIKNLRAFDKIIITKIPDNDSRDPFEVEAACKEFEIDCEIIEQPEDALKAAKKDKARIVICGSLYLAGYVLEKGLK